jgi:hypothetical protein
VANSRRAAVSSLLRVAAGSRRCRRKPLDRLLDISNQIVDKLLGPLLHW